MSTSSSESHSASSGSSAPSVRHVLRVLFQRFERCFAGTVIFLASGAILQGILRAGDEMTTGGWIYLVWGSAYAITACLVIVRHREVAQVLRVLRQEPLLVALLVYTALSFLWASDPLLTGRRVVIFGGTVLIGVYLAARFSLYEIFRLAGMGLAIAGFLSVVVVFLFPEIGLNQDSRPIGIEGIFGNKNTLGRALSLGAALSFFLGLDKWIERRKFWIGTFLILATIVFFSQSKTSLVALAVVILLVPLFQLLRSPGKLLIPSLIVIGSVLSVLGLLVYANWNSILALLGRDETLSSRLAIWYATVVMILQEPWLGYGYGADWLRELGSFGYLFNQYFEDWEPGHAHNGLLQVGFELGAVGVILLGGHLFRFAEKSVRWIRMRSQSYAAFLPLAFLVTLVGANTTQTTILSRNGVYWVLYVAISLALSRAIRHDRVRSLKGDT